MKKIGFFAFEQLSEEEVNEIFENFKLSECNFVHYACWAKNSYGDRICEILEIYGEQPDTYEEDMISTESIFDNDYLIDEYNKAYK